jgi:hypothetical protein
MQGVVIDELPFSDQRSVRSSGQMLLLGAAGVKATAPILPKSCVLPGMRILKGFPVPGHVEIGIVKRVRRGLSSWKPCTPSRSRPPGGIALYRAAA